MESLKVSGTHMIGPHEFVSGGQIASMAALARPAMAEDGVVTAVIVRWNRFKGNMFEAVVCNVDVTAGGATARIVKRSTITPDTSKPEVDQHLVLSPPMAVKSGQFLGVISLGGEMLQITYFEGGAGCYFCTPCSSKGGFPAEYLSGKGMEMKTPADTSKTLALRWVAKTLFRPDNACRSTPCMQACTCMHGMHVVGGQAGSGELGAGMYFCMDNYMHTRAHARTHACTHTHTALCPCPNV